ncbi:MAG: type II secretion system protein [Candidatus Hydrogenedentota bacterium]
MSRTCQPSMRNGFTLLEILVSIAIMGVVASLGVRSFALLTSSWADARAMAELGDTVDDAFELIALDLGDVLSAELSGVSITGIDRMVETDAFNQAGDADDRLIIPTQGLSAALSLQRVRSVQYQVYRDDEFNKLVRTVGPLGSDNPKNGRSEIISRANVVRFDVSYATGDSANPWVSSWDGETLPKAVRVALTLSDPNNGFRQVSRKKVYPVHVQ